jgi:uncharacterized protein YdeI (YjbR/CyaY-like superfamily)
LPQGKRDGRKEIVVGMNVKRMTKKHLAGGVVHEMPADFRKAVASDPKALSAWEDITPLARNEWICWVTSGKKAETRSHRIQVGLSKLRSGMRRPCCWAGCPHRPKSPK